MTQVLITLNGYAVTVADALGGALALIALLFLLALIAFARARSLRRREGQAAEARGRELGVQIAALAQSSAELNGRLSGMAETLGSRQAELARVMAERLDSVSARVGAGLEAAAQTTGLNLGKLNERLAVIDAAQERMKSMTSEVSALKDILANKQTRGAFGQGRMEAIVRDGLPPDAYDFQASLSTGKRPDCVIRLPGDSRVLAVDAKFPLESFTLFKDARSDVARKEAIARVRNDVGKHVKDIAERYLLPGETQDMAMMFVPSESIYSELVEHFDDVVQKAHRAKVVIVSPALLMMAIQVMQTIVRDSRMREEAHVIQSEVGKLLNDVRLLAERTQKLELHFRQAQEDVGAIAVSTEKIARRAERIDTMEFGHSGPPVRLEGGPQLRLAKGGD